MPRKPPKSPNQWGPDNPPPKGGRPKGSRDRRTIVLEILETLSKKKKFKGKTLGEEATYAIVQRALKGDTYAWEKLMDSGYGKVADQQEILMKNPVTIKRIHDDVYKKGKNEPGATKQPIAGSKPAGSAGTGSDKA